MSKIVKRKYTVRDWRKLLPITDRLKYRRNSLVSRIYCSRQSPDTEAVLRALAERGHPKLLATIAFNKPWLIDLMVRAVARHMPQWRLIVADNSNQAQARDEIRRICDSAGVLYVGLPPNPEWSINRSHGIAINWIVRNVILKARPVSFGVLDHDCFPFGPDPVSHVIENQPVYGLERTSRFAPGAWYLWPGYAFFNLASLGDVTFDFNHDQSLWLDTGGCNWHSIYKGLDRATLLFPSEPADDEHPAGLVNNAGAFVDRTFCHIGSMGHRSEAGRQEHVAALRGLIEQSIAEPT
ncbi:hypothetical protein [Chthonobacter albigriseus]|uniref:hypothetical protein n=1 Tax=Chthonobacter albigriseus TaxID=1683161 RepID=UPI0015EF5C39|nr:hypothetical protein [Chthonobacter albigriseus]